MYPASTKPVKWQHHAVFFLGFNKFFWNLRYRRIRRKNKEKYIHYMESMDKVQIAKQAIKEIMEQDQVSEHKPTAKHLLFQLLSQLDSLQEEDAENLCPEVDRTEEKPKEQLDSSQEEDGEKLCPEVVKTEEIIKEVKNVKRQNLVTQCLVSTMILLTVAWQISEVSMVLKVQKGLRNPFNFVGGIVKGLILKGASAEADVEQSSSKQKPVIKPPLTKFPDLPLLDLPIFYSSLLSKHNNTNIEEQKSLPWIRGTIAVGRFLVGL